MKEYSRKFYTILSIVFCALLVFSLFAHPIARAGLVPHKSNPECVSANKDISLCDYSKLLAKMLNYKPQPTNLGLNVKNMGHTSYKNELHLTIKYNFNYSDMINSANYESERVGHIQNFTRSICTNDDIPTFIRAGGVFVFYETFNDGGEYLHIRVDKCN